MAIIRTYKSVENDVYVVTFVNDQAALSEQDKKLMQKFGEPEVNLGGTFMGESELTYVLPDKLARIHSDFPQTIRLDSRGEPFDSDTLAKVNGYVDEMLTRFQAAFTELREQTDTFTGESATNI